MAPGPTRCSHMTTADKSKRAPGRPKGYPKSGGRARGTPNRDRTATIERIQKEADPILFLCKVCRGDRMEAAPEPGAKKRTHWFPTADQRITAAQTLARKIMPDQKAVESTGANGGPVTISLLDFLKGLPA